MLQGGVLAALSRQKSRYLGQHRCVVVRVGHDQHSKAGLLAEPA